MWKAHIVIVGLIETLYTMLSIWGLAILNSEPEISSMDKTNSDTGWFHYQEYFRTIMFLLEGRKIQKQQRQRDVYMKWNEDVWFMWFRNQRKFGILLGFFLPQPSQAIGFVTKLRTLIILKHICFIIHHNGMYYYKKG